MKTINLKKKTVETIKTILEAQKNNFEDPEVIKNISLLQKPQIAIAKRQIKKILKEIDEELQ